MRTSLGTSCVLSPLLSSALQRHLGQPYEYGQCTVKVAKGSGSGVNKSLSQFSKQGNSTHWAARKRRYRCILPTDWPIESDQGETAVHAAQQATKWPGEMGMIALFTNFSILFRKFMACLCVGTADFRAHRWEWKASHGLDHNFVAIDQPNHRRGIVARVLRIPFAVQHAQEAVLCRCWCGDILASL